MIRVALLSFWHVHARDYVQQARANPATTITAVWDETPERGRAQAHALGVPFYENLPELLTQAQVDGVMVTTPTTTKSQPRRDSPRVRPSAIARSSARATKMASGGIAGRM